jgi:uncharacterized protein YjiS (DUF1127 family)
VLWQNEGNAETAPYCAVEPWEEVNDVQKWGIYRRTVLALGSLSVLAAVLGAGVKWS